MKRLRKIINKGLAGSVAAIMVTATFLTAPAYGASSSLSSSPLMKAMNKQSVETSGRMGAAMATYSLQDQDMFRTVEEAMTGRVNSSSQSSSLPSYYDLRSKGTVTPVKNQYPWGSCWGFGTMAASETSILSSLKETYSEDNIDLSERQLAWFAYTAVNKGTDGTKKQKGEGLYEMSAKNRMNGGGLPLFSAMLFASGIGPVNESLVPYKNNKDLIYHDEKTGKALYYSESGGWNVLEKYRFYANYELKESLLLPSPVVTTARGTYKKYDSSATTEIKKQIKAGNPVVICYQADEYDGEGSKYKYMNPSTYAQYTYDNDAVADHAVTIVGWDDNYSKSNFLQGKAKNGRSRTPKGNGAWIVKNSWGASDSEFPNSGDWGINGSGYFYLSYYDKSISSPETFTYDTNYISKSKNLKRVINQHDYMPATAIDGIPLKEKASVANIFTSPKKQRIRSLSVMTSFKNTNVTYKLYRLKKKYKSPTDGKLVYKKTVKYRYGGYHKLNFNKKSAVMKKGQKFSVVVTQKAGKYSVVVMNINFNKKGWSYMRSIGLDPGYYAKGVVNKGESLVKEKKRWKDWTSYVKAYKKQSGNTLTADNFCVKAYGKPL